jgi:hypothetical protein
MSGQKHASWLLKSTREQLPSPSFLVLDSFSMLLLASSLLVLASYPSFLVQDSF